MKNQNSIGLGFLALVISLNLLFLGTIAVKNASPEALLSVSDPSYTISELDSNAADGGILQRQFETSESSDSVRKFPAIVCLPFFALKPLLTTKDVLRTGEFVSNFAFKRIFLEFRNLRI